MKLFMAIVLVLVLASSAMAIEKKAYTMRDDFGTEPLYDCTLNYYYYCPCPTYSWFWAYSGWSIGDVIGEYFVVGDQGTGGVAPCDPYNCHTLEQVRVLDFAGYGIYYPGLFTFELDVYCADTDGCPVGASLYNSGPLETGPGWNYFVFDPTVCVTYCAIEGPPPAYPRFLVTATMTGTDAEYPAWGMDNISTAVEQGCELHDYGCLTALYPRPYTSHWGVIHSGYYGLGFQYCPPLWFCDGRDTTPTCIMFGAIELAWRVYMICEGPTATEPSTWGNIKSMYR
jgi:hypothetical protein